MKKRPRSKVPNQRDRVRAFQDQHRDDPGLEKLEAIRACLAAAFAPPSGHLLNWQHATADTLSRIYNLLRDHLESRAPARPQLGDADPEAMLPLLNEARGELVDVRAQLDGMRDSGLAKLFRAERDKSHEAVRLVVEGLRLQVGELRNKILDVSGTVNGLSADKLGAQNDAREEIGELRGRVEAMRGELDAQRSHLQGIHTRVNELADVDRRMHELEEGYARWLRGQGTNT